MGLKMKTIDEHNKEYYEAMQSCYGADVLCNDCKVEMFYSQPCVLLTTIPPKKAVECPECHKTDYKIMQ
jgi:hypothetical protein